MALAWEFQQAVMGRTGFIVALCALAGLAACGEHRPAAVAGAEVAAGPAGADYAAPPAVLTVQATGADLSLSGSAAAGARVRLATPDGQALFAGADAQGRWRLALGPLAAPRIYGLSAAGPGSGPAAQAQGYILATPAGEVALLRAGASAMRIDRPAASGLRSLDFDRAGGAAVSAAVRPGATVALRLDGRQIAQGRADAAGRFEASAPAPIPPGPHRLQIVGDGFADRADVVVSPPAPLVQGPLRSQFTGGGLRVDWLTPGGGVQSTLLIH